MVVSLYLRFLNPLLALVIFGFCTWAAIYGDGEINFGGPLDGGIASYMFAKGIFCSLALLLMGALLGQLSHGGAAELPLSAKAHGRAQLGLAVVILGTTLLLMAEPFWALEAPEAEQATSAEPEIDPSGLRVVDVYRIAEAENFRLGGTLRNETDGAWSYAYLRLAVQDQGRLLAERCSTSINNLAAGGEAPFILECDGLRNDATAATVSWTIEIEAAPATAGTTTWGGVKIP
jgi:hypothetical protein